MLGLIKKDVLLLQSYLKNLLLITAMFSGLSLINESYSFLAASLPCMFSILCFTLISYDDYYHWDAYSRESKRQCAEQIYRFHMSFGLWYSFRNCIVIRGHCHKGYICARQRGLSHSLRRYLHSIRFDVSDVSHCLPIRNGKGTVCNIRHICRNFYFIVLLGKALMTMDLQLQSVTDFFTGSGKYLLIPLILVIIFVSYCISCSIFTRKEY